MNKFIAVFLTLLSLAGVHMPLVSAQDVATKSLHLSESLGPALTNDDILKTDSNAARQSEPLQIPDGTPIEIEAPYTFNSMDFKPNDKISFRVLTLSK